MAAQPEPRQAGSTTGGTNFNLLAFVAMAFVVVGLLGVFATYAAPLPLERALAREAALDAALAAARGANPEAALAALKPQLDDSTGVLVGGVGGIEERIAHERIAMRARFTTEAAATALRLRWLIGMVTLMGAVFTMTMMGSSVRRT
jgi:hypothetical protein